MSGRIDWPAVYDEALDVLRRYLRIDTQNPPGNEAAAARFLGALLEAEGVACEYIETAPGREVLAARLLADPSRRTGRPLLLGNHTDVVPVEESLWSVPPFGGVVQDGRIYGRGAVDMKAAAVMQLFALLLAKRAGLPLRRDILFLACPDEEVGSEWGMAWLVQHRPDLLDVDFALNEGASGLAGIAAARPAARPGEPSVPLFTVAVTEKEMCPLRIVATGTAGHAARPTDDNSAHRLVLALARLARWDRPLRIDDATRAYLEPLVAAGVVASPEDRDAIERVLRQSVDTQAAFQDTMNLTIVQVGVKQNVVPARSEAIVDCRLVPGQTPEAWRAEVEAYIDDPQVRVEFVYETQRHRPAVSPTDTDLYRAIDAAVCERFPAAAVVPTVSIVGTDNRFLRLLGIPAYGFIPALLTQQERDGFHAHDEHITLDNFRLGLELTYDITRRTCT